MCFGCSKEPSHRDGSFEYPQHMFWLRNKNNNFQLLLSGGLLSPDQTAPKETTRSGPILFAIYDTGISADKFADHKGMKRVKNLIIQVKHSECQDLQFYLPKTATQNRLNKGL